MLSKRKYNCLLLEDEPIAAEIVEGFLYEDSDFKLIEVCTDALQAYSVLKRETIDLLILDLHLPVIKGFEFLKKLENPPFVIVTTAYHEYALDGFELNVVDYLLKPFSKERFVQATQKFKHLMAAEEALLDFSERESLDVTFGKKKIKIFLDDILFIESFREYIKINTKREVVTIKMPISKMEAQLDAAKFQRVHKSYIVALNKITTETCSELTIGNVKIPIGRKFK